MPRSDVLRSPIPQDLNLALPDGTEVSSQMIAIGEGDIAIQEQVCHGSRDYTLSESDYTEHAQDIQSDAVQTSKTIRRPS